ncbi:MAG TPA: AMP-binding protein [Polyangiaceae bacterium]|jgi:fatty-acyl-CoA synthase|nr:AMP-binding protein [Polyangiaceae bacterium]
MASRFETFRNRMKDVPGRARAAWHMGRSTGMMWELRPSGVAQLLKMINRDYQNPSAVFTIHAKNQPDRVALRFRGRGLTYAELDDRIDRLASGLISRGLQRKQAVLVMMKNRPEFIELGAAAGRVGAAAVSVSWRSTPAELAYLAGNSGARFVFFDHEMAATIAQAREKIDLPSDRFVAIGGDVEGCARYEDFLSSQKLAIEGDDEAAAVVTYTSGTTGKPKGAVRRFPREMFSQILEFIAQTPIKCDDVHLVVCPMYHMTAWAFLTMTFAVGGTVVIADDFKPESFLELVEKERVTTTAMVPTMLNRLVTSGEATIHARRTRSLRAIFCGGAQLQGQLAIQAMDLLGDVVFNFYGATELGIVTLASPADLRAAPGTIGPVVPGNDVLLLDDQKNPVKDGDVGELYVKNAMLVAGYHGNEDAMRESMHAGHFSVGDLARRDGDGRFFIEGRKRDMVITGGVNVYPAEVENAIEEHPQVLEAAVVGVPDPEWGERVKAFVVARSGERIDGEELKQFLRERIAGPKIPREYAFIDALPRNPTGKVLKNELRTRA